MSDRTVARWLVVAIGSLYLGVQLLVATMTRAPGWDESVYLAQVTPGIDEMPWDAWRSRGITLLVAPVTSIGGSIDDVRLFLVIASAVAITATFLVWVPLVWFAAPLAAYLFAFSGLVLIYGAEVMPNLWAAILGIAAAGLIARRLEGGTAVHTVSGSIALGAMAVVRPTDAALLAGVIGVWILIVHRTSWRVLGPIACGLALGWLPWSIEMSARFGGPIGALREAAAEHFATASVARNVVVNLAGASGPFNREDVTWGAVVWWALIIALALFGVIRAMTPAERRIAILACLAATAFAVEYLVFVLALATRFLLPAYGFASVAAAIGLASALRRPTGWRIAGGAVLLLMLPWALWQGLVADRTDAHRARAASPYRHLGGAIRNLAGGRPCVFMSPRAWPQVQYAAGCEGSPIRQQGPTEAELEELLARGEEVFVIMRRPAPRTSPLAGLTATAVRTTEPSTTWQIYRVPDR